MNMFARFDENQAMTFQDIKETKRYGRMHARTHKHARTDNVKPVYPPQTKVCGGGGGGGGRGGGGGGVWGGYKDLNDKW